MVPTARCASRFHWVLYTHWYVVSKHTSIANTRAFLSIPQASPQMFHLKVLHVLYIALTCVCLFYSLSLSAGVWAAFFMKWSLADLSSLDRLWRTSFTSYSASLVRRHSGIWTSICLCKIQAFVHVCVCTLYIFPLHLQQVLLQKRLGLVSPPVKSLRRTISPDTKRSPLSITHPGVYSHGCMCRFKDGFTI